MALLILRRGQNISNKPKSLGVLTGQVMFATGVGGYRNNWIDMATYSSLADAYENTRNVRRWQKVGKFDDWGRIKRTEIWG